MDFYLDFAIKDDIIKDILQQIFPNLQIWNSFYVEIEKSKEHQHLFFETQMNEEILEFGFSIEVYSKFLQEKDFYEYEIAKVLSAQLNTRVLIPYILPTDPTDPYYDLIFMENKVFLADDIDTNWGGEDTDNLIKILHELKDF